MMFPSTMFPSRAVPPLLRRPLLCCVAALAAVLLLRFAATSVLEAREKELDSLRVSVREAETALTAAREEESTRAALAQRFAAVSAVLEKAPPDETEWKQLTRRLAGDERILAPDLSVGAVPVHSSAPSMATVVPVAPVASPEGLPRINIQRLQINAGLLHEEALLALDALVTDTSAHVVPVGCVLRREENDAPVPLRARCEFDWIALAPPGKVMSALAGVAQ